MCNHNSFPFFKSDKTPLQEKSELPGAIYTLNVQ